MAATKKTAGRTRKATSRRTSTPKEEPIATEVGADEVQAKFDEASEKGYFGSTPDPTPNENYSLLTPDDAPTPETDPELAAQTGSRKFTNVNLSTASPDA